MESSLTVRKREPEFESKGKPPQVQIVELKDGFGRWNLYFGKPVVPLFTNRSPFLDGKRYLDLLKGRKIASLPSGVFVLLCFAGGESVGNSQTHTLVAQAFGIHIDRVKAFGIELSTEGIPILTLLAMSTVRHVPKGFHLDNCVAIVSKPSMVVFDHQYPIVFPSEELSHDNERDAEQAGRSRPRRSQKTALPPAVEEFPEFLSSLGRKRKGKARSETSSHELD